MKLRHVMNRRVAAVAANTPLREAARQMSAQDVPVLPVCDGLTLVGLITPRDLIVRATGQGCDPRTGTVREVMTREVICGRDDQDVNEAASLMQRRRLARLPVVNRQQHLVGIVSLNDLRGYVGVVAWVAPGPSPTHRARTTRADGRHKFSRERKGR